MLWLAQVPTTVVPITVVVKSGAPSTELWVWIVGGLTVLVIPWLMKAAFQRAIDPALERIHKRIDDHMVVEEIALKESGKTMTQGFESIRDAQRDNAIDHAAFDARLKSGGL